MSSTLTGIANRRRFDELAKAEWFRALRTNHMLGVIMVDVDHFKLYNDTSGHPAGDKVLQAVAGVLRDCSRRPSDIAARYGGEEFVILAANTSKLAVLALAERVRTGVEALGIANPGTEHGVVTVSVGVSVAVPTQGTSFAALLTSADLALYRAKDLGRNAVASE